MTMPYYRAAGPSTPSHSRSGEGRRNDRPHRIAGPLPPALVADLTRALRRQRAFRVDQLAGLDAAGNPPSDPVRREVDATLRSSARLVLIEIDAALHRIELGSFGRCGRCGEVMSVDPLRALPMSTWCGSCHHLRELTVVEPLAGSSERGAPS